MQHLIQHQQERQADWLREQQQAQRAQQASQPQSQPAKRFSLSSLFVRPAQLASSK
jgi:hypothetical protein